MVGERSGCGPVELAILEATAGECPGYLVSTAVVRKLEARLGVGPRYGYEALADLARPWLIPVPLIDVQGNIGDRDRPVAAAPRYTESRPSAAGRLVLDAEAGRAARVPVGVINGTTYRGGQQPPLSPSRVIAALRRVLDDPRVPDGEVLETVGPPQSTAGCDITGDLDALIDGHPAVIHEIGRVTVTDVPVPLGAAGPPHRDRQRQGAPGGHSGIFAAGGGTHAHHHPVHLVIDSIPPRSTTGDVAQEISSLATTYQWQGPHHGLPIADIADHASGREGVPVRIVVSLLPGADRAEVRDRLTACESMTAEATWAFPAPPATLLRSWVERHRSEDIAASLTKLEEATRR